MRYERAAISSRATDGATAVHAAAIATAAISTATRRSSSVGTRSSSSRRSGSVCTSAIGSAAAAPRRLRGEQLRPDAVAKLRPGVVRDRAGLRGAQQRRVWVRLHGLLVPARPEPGASGGAGRASAGDSSAARSASRDADAVAASAGAARAL